MNNHSKKVIVTTTINAPTQAVRLFDQRPDWSLIVVGDKKTPKDYRLERGRYVSPEEQEAYDPKLSELIGWNCIQRRNMGFLMALDMGADLVATIDDDNIPNDSWGEDLIVGQEVEMTCFDTDLPCFDPVGATNYPHLWHRGFPLQLLAKRDYSCTSRRRVKVDVQANFWDGDPDIDAFCRLEHAPDCRFDASPFPLASNAISPFNSQNTILTRDALKYYFMFPGVGRMDDIWASYHLQSLGFKVAFASATVHQDRNEQDLTKNMIDEFLGYEKNLTLVRAIASGEYQLQDYLPERTFTAYQHYLQRSCST